MNNFCSTLQFIFVLSISQHCELYFFEYQEKLTMVSKQLYRYASKHQASKRRFDGKQRVGAGEHASSRPVNAQIGFPVVWLTVEFLFAGLCSDGQKLSIDKMSVVLLMAHILKLCNTVTRTF
jgi:hypothetical protein